MTTTTENENFTQSNGEKDVVLKAKSKALSKEKNLETSGTVSENAKKGSEVVYTASDQIKILISSNFNIVLNDKQAGIFYNLCGGEPGRLADKIDLLKLPKSYPIKNPIGWLISALKEDYKASKYISKNGFFNFEQREWDYDEIERLAMEELMRVKIDD